MWGRVCLVKGETPAAPAYATADLDNKSGWLSDFTFEVIKIAANPYMVLTLCSGLS